MSNLIFPGLIFLITLAIIVYQKSCIISKTGIIISISGILIYAIMGYLLHQNPPMFIGYLVYGGAFLCILGPVIHASKNKKQ